MMCPVAVQLLTARLIRYESMRLSNMKIHYLCVCSHTRREDPLCVQFEFGSLIEPKVIKIHALTHALSNSISFSLESEHTYDLYIQISEKEGTQCKIVVHILRQRC